MVLFIPEDQAITSIDAGGHESVGPVAASCGGELISLTLWLIAERAKGPASLHASLSKTTSEWLWEFLSDIFIVD